MRIRTIALALPVVMGIAACQTSKTQGSRTARTDRQGEASGDAQASAGGASASGSATGSTAGTPSASGTVNTPGTTGSTSTGTGSTASGDVYGGTGTTGSSDAKAHSDDQIVTGRIASVSTESITIKTLDGSDKMLQLVPETSVKVDGQDALGSDLQEGQPVRAAFNTVGDRDVAVDVRAGKGATDSTPESGSMPDSGTSGSGSSSSGSSGSGTSSDTGSTGSGTSGTTGSDRKY